MTVLGAHSVLLRPSVSNPSSPVASVSATVVLTGTTTVSPMFTDAAGANSVTSVTSDSNGQFPTFFTPLGVPVDYVTGATVSNGQAAGGTTFRKNVYPTPSISPSLAVGTTRTNAAPGGAVAVGEHAMIDTTAGAVALTLTAAPADGSELMLELAASGTTVVPPTYAAGSGDTLDPTLSGQVLYVGETVRLRYDKGAKAWRPAGSRFPATVVQALSSALTATRSALASAAALADAVAVRTLGLRKAGRGPNVPALVAPKGWGASWYALLDSNADQTRLLEVVFFGDSTTYGAEAVNSNFSYLDQMRTELLASGRVDGGKGVFGTEEALMTGRPGTNPTEVNGVVNNGWGSASDFYDLLSNGSFQSTTKGNTLTVQFYGTQCRIWYTRRSNLNSAFSYAIDGGTAVTVDTALPGGNGDPLRAGWTLITGLTAGLHTMVLTNLGTAPVFAPTNVGGNLQVLSTGQASTLTQGQWYGYKFTVTTNASSSTAVGETLPSNAFIAQAGGSNQGIAVSTNGNAVGTQQNYPSGSTFNVYRSTGTTQTAAAAAPYQLIATQQPIGNPQGGTMQYVDTGAAAVPAQTAPTSSTAGRRTDVTFINAAIAPTFDTGIVLHKFAKVGGTADKTFLGQVADVTTCRNGFVFQQPMGLAMTSTPTAPSFSGMTPDSDSTAIKPVLACYDLMFNDLSNASSQAQIVQVATVSIQKFAAACAAAGCPGVVMSGNLPNNPNHWTDYGAAVQKALRDTALSLGLAFWDSYSPVTPYTNTATSPVYGPHLAKNYYQLQGTALWRQLLGLGADTYLGVPTY